jgi:cytoskeletal protein CcmA (bactofilin family)
MMNTVRKLWGRRLLLFGLLAALIALFAAPLARAAEVRGGEDIVIGRGEVIEGDLYVAANSVTVDGTIKGDLVTVASQVTVNGTVEGDLLAAGQAIVINGVVRDDARIGGQAILLGPAAQVDGDLAVGGLSLENQSGSVVRGDLLIGAYQALLAGDIGRNINGGLNRMELRGAVGGDVDIGIGSDTDPSAVQFSPAGAIPIPRVGPRLTVADSARIGGKLIYHSSTEATLNPSSPIAGGVTFDPLPAQPPAQPVIPGLSYLQRFASLLLVGLLLLWLAPAWTRRLADTVEEKPLPSLGWGLVAFFAFIAAVLAVLVLMIALAVLLGWLTLGGLVGMTIVVGLLLDRGGLAAGRGAGERLHRLRGLRGPDHRRLRGRALAAAAGTAGMGGACGRAAGPGRAPVHRGAGYPLDRAARRDSGRAGRPGCAVAVGPRDLPAVAAHAGADRRFAAGIAATR